MKQITHTYTGTIKNLIQGIFLSDTAMLKALFLGLFMLICFGIPHTIHAQVTLSGTVYTDAGVTADAVARTIKVAVGTSTPGVFSTTSSVTTGAWTVTIPAGHNISTSTPILVWIDNDVTRRGEVLTKSSSSQAVFSIIGLDLYRDRVIVSHEATSGTSTTLTDFSFYTSANDSDIQHSTSTGLLTITSGNELFVWAGKTFAPGGALTVAGNALASTTDGSMFFATSSIYTAGGQTTLAGSLRASATASFNPGNFFTVFNATTTAKVINTTLSTLGNVRFSGVGGAWSFTQASATTSEFTIVSGTVTSPVTSLVVTGSFQNYGSFTHNSATLRMNGPVSTSTADIALFAVGRDVSGSAAGTSNLAVNAYVTVGNYLYVAKAGDATACSQTAGSAIGCELMVFDISSTTNPVYVAGRDTTGDATGIGTLAINGLAVSGNFLYVSKGLSLTACSQTAGSAIGCELMVFSIASTTNPVYVAGRDGSGSAAGTGAVAATALAINGNTLYFAKAGDATACSQTAGSAIGCELMVFDISSTTNPVYVAGQDVSGSAAGTGFLTVNQLFTTTNNKLYAVKGGNATACSQTAGSAIGCELMVWDISSTTNPVYVAGRDVNGDSTGTGNLNVSAVTISNSGLFIAKAGSVTPCAQVVGTGAAGCELMAFDISSTTNPVYVAGRDVGGSATGIQNLNINYVSAVNNLLYVAKAASAIPCSQVAGLAIGCELMVFDIASTAAPTYIAGRDVGGDIAGVQSLGINGLGFSANNIFIAKAGSVTACSQTVGVGTIGCELMSFNTATRTSGLLAGTLLGGSALNHVVASGTVQFLENASTTNLTISANATLSAPNLLTIGGDYNNQGLFTANDGTATFASVSAQNITGTMGSTSSFARLIFTGSGAKTFSNNASATKIIITSGTTVVAPAQLAFSDTFTNNGTFTAGGGTIFSNGYLGEFQSAFSAGAGTSTDLQTLGVNAYVATGTILYIAKAGSVTACSNTSGSAVGCELMVFDVSSTTNPIYVVGRDTSGNAAGTQSVNIVSMAISGNYLYTAKAGSATACSQTAGSAAGCELLVWDISSTTNPVYVAGRDISGDSTGVGNLAASGIIIINNSLIMVKAGNGTACSNIAGSASGCEIMSFDISSGTNPIYTVGRDASGSAAGTDSSTLTSVGANSTMIYVTKAGSATACSQTAGSAVGCELMVFDVSSTTNPVYVAGRDGAGAAAGAVSAPMQYATVDGNILYIAKTGSATACSQTVGSATGCEIMIWDISSTTNPTYIAGRDVSGNAVGTGNLAVNSLFATSSLLYVGKVGDATACAQNAGGAIGCELMVFDVGSSTNPTYIVGKDSNGLRDGQEAFAIQSVYGAREYVVTGKAGNASPCELTLGLTSGCETMSYQLATFLTGTLTGSSALSGLTALGQTRFVTATASTSNITIATSSLLTAPTADLTVSGNFTNQGNFIANNGAVILTGTNQTLTSVATTTFYDLIQQTNVAATTTFSIAKPFIVARTLTLAGTSSALLKLRSQSTGSQWKISPQSSTTVIARYLDVKDSQNSSTSTVPLVCTVGCISRGNNTNWSFVSAVPEWNATAWSLYDTITVRESNIDEDLINFPVYVDLSNLPAAFWSTVSGNGGDIRVTTDGGAPVELARELISFATTTQKGELYFKAPSISSTTDTVYRVYYNGTTTGDYNTTDTYGAKSVWSENYVAVYHLSENPGGGAGAIKDSTAFSNDGTGSTTMTLADSIAGKMGQGVDFDGAATDYITTATSDALGNLKTLTMCTWYKHDTYRGAYSTLLDKSTDGVSNWTMYLSNSNKLGTLNNSGGYKEVLYSPTTGWEHLCATSINSNASTSINMYKNSVNMGLQFSGIVGAPANDATLPLQIGAGNNGVYPLDGQMDEIRISSTTRTQAWVKAEYYNQSTTTDFYIVNAGLIVGSSTLAAHTAGQVPNAFSNTNKTNESLFAFKLTPNSGIATVTALVINLSGVTNVVDTDFSNVRLFRDLNNNALYDGTDTAVGGSGVLSIANGGGSITFSTGFVSSTTQTNYLVVADFNAPINGSYMTISLIRENITMVGQNPTHFVLGSVTSVQHQRNNRSGGGGSSNVGGDAPAGAGTVGGGGTTGGELIGNDPDYFLPTGNSGSWSGGANAYDGVDGTYASTSAATNHSYSNHGFSLPGGNVVSGIIVKLELSGSTAAGTVDVQLSWDGGTSWTAVKTTPTLTTADAVRTLGSPSDLWGRTWSSAEFSNANFAVRISGNPSANSIRLDALIVRVYHVAGGGGSGGGGSGGGI